MGVQRELGWGYVVTADYALRQGENVSQGELDYNLNSRYINGVQTPVIPACSTPASCSWPARNAPPVLSLSGLRKAAPATTVCW